MYEINLVWCTWPHACASSIGSLCVFGHGIARTRACTLRIPYGTRAGTIRTRADTLRVHDDAVRA